MLYAQFFLETFVKHKGLRFCIPSFYKAIGPFVDYSVALEEIDAQRVLFLAIPEPIHYTTKLLKI
jgi:hypothetical protein